MSTADLAKIEERLHELIRARTQEIMGREPAELPILSADRGINGRRAWFPVPGMYGGFAYWFSSEGADTCLMVESWSRVIGGSGARHRIMEAGCELLDEGFV